MSENTLSPALRKLFVRRLLAMRAVPLPQRARNDKMRDVPRTAARARDAKARLPVSDPALRSHTPRQIGGSWF